MLTTVEIEAKLTDFIELLHEWVDRYERLGVPRRKLLAQMRVVLINMETDAGIDREATAIGELKQECDQIRQERDQVRRVCDQLRAALEAHPEWTDELDPNGCPTAWQRCVLCGGEGQPGSERYPLAHKLGCLRALARKQGQ